MPEPFDDLTSGGPQISSAELASAVLEQMGEDVQGPFGSPTCRQAYARHRLGQYLTSRGCVSTWGWTDVALSGFVLTAEMTVQTGTLAARRDTALGEPRLAKDTRRRAGC